MATSTHFRRSHPVLARCSTKVRRNGEVRGDFRSGQFCRDFDNLWANLANLRSRSTGFRRSGLVLVRFRPMFGEIAQDASGRRRREFSWAKLGAGQGTQSGRCDLARGPNSSWDWQKSPNTSSSIQNRSTLPNIGRACSGLVRAERPRVTPPSISLVVCRVATRVGWVTVAAPPARRLRRFSSCWMGGCAPRGGRPRLPRARMRVMDLRRCSGGPEEEGVSGGGGGSSP